MTGNPEERTQRSPLVIAIIGGGLGLLFLAMGFNRPTIADMRTVDLVHLLGTGACFGAALVGLALHFVGRRKR